MKNSGRAAGSRDLKSITTLVVVTASIPLIPNDGMSGAPEWLYRVHRTEDGEGS
jgi:hypothetical protein